jgi:hypothetical protein
LQFSRAGLASEIGSLDSRRLDPELYILGNCLRLLFLSGAIKAASETGVGIPVQRTFWRMAAAEYLRENPDLFARLANAYLGLGGEPLPAGSIENQYARVIPGFDPVAAACLRLRLLPSNASVSAKRIALGSLRDAVNTLVDALYSAEVEGDKSSGCALRLKESYDADPGGLLAPRTDVATLFSKFASIQGFEPRKLTASSASPRRKW